MADLYATSWLNPAAGMSAYPSSMVSNGASSMTTGGSMGPIAAVAIPAAASFFSSLFGSGQQARDSRLNRQHQRDMQDREFAFGRERDLRNVASEEAKLDPWRNVMAQVNHSQALDRFANSEYTPVEVSRGPNGGFSRSGGTTYSKNPQVVAAARAAAKMILEGGGRAPSMANASNYGKTGAMDLLNLDARGNAVRSVDDPWALY